MKLGRQKVRAYAYAYVHCNQTTGIEVMGDFDEIITPINCRSISVFVFEILSLRYFHSILMSNTYFYLKSVYIFSCSIVPVKQK